MGELVKIQEENERMRAESRSLEEECSRVEKQMVESERKKRELEFQHREKVRQEEAVDVSDLMGQLYREVKNIIDQDE